MDESEDAARKLSTNNKETTTTMYIGPPDSYFEPPDDPPDDDEDCENCDGPASETRYGNFCDICLDDMMRDIADEAAFEMAREEKWNRLEGGST